MTVFTVTFRNVSVAVTVNTCGPGAVVSISPPSDTEPTQLTTPDGSPQEYDAVAMVPVPIAGIVAGERIVMTGPTASTTVTPVELSPAGYVPSPAKRATTTSGWLPAARPPMLTADTDATPASSVTAEPASAPFSEKLTLWPGSGTAFEVSTARMSVVPPSGASVDETTSVEGSGHLPVTPARYTPRSSSADSARS